MAEDLLSYSLKTEGCEPIQLIPTLEELIIGVSSGSYYNMANFVNFLTNLHCLENLEFILELNSYLELSDEFERKQYWLMLHRDFLEEESPKEINLPYAIKKNFQEQALPSSRDLVNAKSTIYEILLDSYNEFIKHVKLTTNDTSRRKSEITPPEINSFSTSLSSRNIPRSVSIGDSQQVTTCKLGPYVDNYDLEPPLTPVKSRKDSASSSRGSSIGSIVENLKHNDYMNLKKTVKKFRIRRSSNEI